jgi:hypothetical protein
MNEETSEEIDINISRTNTACTEMHDKVVNKYIQIFCDGCVLKNPVKT